VTNFGYCFNYCTSLTGGAPRLWDNTIWSDVTYYSDCFTNTNTLGTNRTTIPTSWGGTSNCNPVTDCTGL